MQYICSHLADLCAKSKMLIAGVFTMLLALFSFPAMAQTELMAGQAVDGQTGFQLSVTPIMDSIIAFHDGILMWVITAIVIFVTILLAYIIVRYNKRANPIASKTTHNVFIEIVWTVVPIIILVVIAVPSFGVLADQQTIPNGERKYLGSNIFSFGEVDMPAPELTIKATGVQWSWDYDYVDYEGADYSSFMLSDEELLAQKPNEPRLLAVDFDLVVPVNTTVRVQVTAADVIHSFAVPSFGIKIDAVPGRLNETWFNVRKTGIYYGQCSELCGKDHAFMPIAVRVVTKDEFAAWVAKVQSDGIEEAAAMLPPIS